MTQDLNMNDSATSSPIKVDELVAALNELLEAERAGARVTLETANQVKGHNLAPLVIDIQRDEVRWCKMLMEVIRSLGALPSTATGSFYQKAIAIEDLKERLLFVNRGLGLDGFYRAVQQCVVFVYTHGTYGNAVHPILVLTQQACVSAAVRKHHRFHQLLS